MEELKQLKQRLKEERPAGWEALPDIPLYMDQVVAYLSRQMISFEETDALTPAMINNYIKAGLVARANGKKYGQEHLAYLTAVSAIKQVMSVREMRALVSIGQEGRDSRQLYDYFCDSLDRALGETADLLGDEADPAELPKLVLDLALRSYASALACREALKILAQQEGQTELLEQKKK